jgi:Multicopper oxidase
VSQKLARRAFLKLSVVGLGVVVVGSRTSAFGEFDWTPARTARLEITTAPVRLIDGTTVPMWSFDASQPRPVPGPVLMAVSGERIEIEVVNAHDRPHAFAVPGVVQSDEIPPGTARTIAFDAPPAGTYLYLDPLQAPLNRLMGLHGALIVMPRYPVTPYDAPTPMVSRYVADIGGWDSTRQWVWLFHQVDPALCARVAAGATTLDSFKPRYFTINGASGFEAATAPDVAIHGHIGEPALIRSLNTGMAMHSPHIHGNHVGMLAANGVVCTDVYERDTWCLPALSRHDTMLPYEVPRDAHPWPPSDDFHFPLEYPMHCHTEMSQTAAGGMYPHGAIAHWHIAKGPGGSLT